MKVLKTINYNSNKIQYTLYFTKYSRVFNEALESTRVIVSTPYHYDIRKQLQIDCLGHQNKNVYKLLINWSSKKTFNYWIEIIV